MSLMATAPLAIFVADLDRVVVKEHPQRCNACGNSQPSEKVAHCAFSFLACSRVTTRRVGLRDSTILSSPFPLYQMQSPDYIKKMLRDFACLQMIFIVALDEKRTT